MITLTDPRIPPHVRRCLDRLLRPGECLRKPKRPPLPCREELLREFYAALIRYGSERRTCHHLAHRYGCHWHRIRGVVRGR